MTVIGPYLADALVVLGVVVVSLGVYGLVRMPDIYLQLHAASKSVLLGVIAFALASIVTGESGIIFRVLLIAVLLLLTTPVAAHSIARAAYRSGEPRFGGDASESQDGPKTWNAEQKPSSGGVAPD